MSTLSVDRAVVRTVGPENSIPIIADDIVFEGAMVGDNAAGYGRPLEAGDKFVGHSIKKVNNTGGSAGDKDIQLLSGRYRLTVPLVGVITDIGQPVYASDDAVYTFAKATVNSYLGVITRYVSATTMEVEFRVGEQDEWGARKRVTKTNDYTTLVGESGEVIYLNTDNKTITLIATVAGYEVIVVCAAPFGTVEIHVDPNSNDLYHGGSGNAANADGDKMTLTQATQQRGDFLHVIGDGGTGWEIVGQRGTWAAE